MVKSINLVLHNITKFSIAQHCATTKSNIAHNMVKLLNLLLHCETSKSSIAKHGEITRSSITQHGEITKSNTAEQICRVYITNTLSGSKRPFGLVYIH